MTQISLVAETKSAARLAFVHYLRTGRRLPEQAFSAGSRHWETKFNPYHDPRNGRFTFAPGGRRTSGIGSASNQPQRLGDDDRPDTLPSGSGAMGGRPDGLDQAAGDLASQAVDQPAEKLIQLAQYKPPPRRGRGNNIQNFYDPMTLQQAFPGLAQTPAGQILAAGDQFLDITGPSQQLTAALTEEFSQKLIRDIQKLDTDYHFEALSVPNSTRGQINQINHLRMQRAVTIYRKLNDPQPLQVEVIRFIQTRVDEAYSEGVELANAGKLSPRLSRNEAIGNYVDRIVRNRVRRMFNKLGISTNRGQNIQVNRRVYDTSNNDVTYRLPDATIGKLAVDWTLQPKTISNSQIRGFFRSDLRPNATVIIRPRQIGGNSVYVIKRPGG